jgi:hypothetical protein
MSPLEASLLRPSSAAGLWLVLHALDYYLTLFGAHWFKRGAHEVMGFGGSYELNPLFQKAIDGRALFAPRFVISWLGGAALFYFVSWWFAGLPDASLHSFLPFILGMLVFTRLAVISTHLNNIWIFRRIALRAGTASGALSYDRPTVFLMSAAKYLATAALLGMAALLVPNAWLAGGASGTALIALRFGASGLLMKQPK